MATAIVARWALAFVVMCSSCTCFSQLSSPARSMRAAAGHFAGCGRPQIAQRTIEIVDTLRMTQHPDDHDSQPDKQHHFFDWTHDDGAPKLEGKPLIGEDKLR